MPLYISLIVIMALVGIWHGAGWGFLLWGIMHGCYLVLYRFTEDLTTAHWPKLENSRLFRAAWQFITLIAVFAAWIPFRAGTLHQSASMLRSMFFTFNFSISYQLNFYLVTMLIAAWCACEPYFASIIERFDQWSLARKRTAVANLYLIRPLAYAFALLLFFAFDELNTGFIYFQF
jgi:D-alanyl-lipoteichoic acid acyltransferase DltB (MBOAT superfamily)